ASGAPTVATIREAIRLSRCVQLIAGVAAGIAAVGVGTLRRRVRRR
ncbi:MAG: cobalamin biosynthesis protein, partial [Corynebacterium sp.]